MGQMYMFLCVIMIDYELFMEILYRCFFVCFSVLYEVFWVPCWLLCEGSTVVEVVTFAFFNLLDRFIIVRLLCVYCALIVRLLCVYCACIVRNIW